MPRWLTAECGDPIYSQRMPGVRVTLGVMRQVSWKKAACQCSRNWSVVITEQDGSSIRTACLGIRQTRLT